jgi:phospho-N-acetylmuramoyl-pentapeptide-transferase
MEGKSPTTRRLNPTGILLSIALAIVLTGAIIYLDWQAGRSAIAAYAVPFTACALFVAGAGFIAIPQLKRLKMGQFIREDGPQAHLKKAGTPTMGGVFIVPIGTIAAILWSQFNPQTIAAALMCLAYFAIGGVDDYKSLQGKKNEGLTPKGKLALQFGTAALFCGWAAYSKGDSITAIDLPFGIVLPLGLLFWAVAAFALVAESNATNLTDGVDGLAGGTGAIALAGLGGIISTSDPALAIFCFCLSGSYFGFLVHNHNKARVFMGDTGSLALGGALAAVGILTNNLWALFLLSGIFFLESLSVIAQVGYYKATKGPDGKGKRLLRMAPFHHHLELGGWTETQVVGTFYIVNLLLALVAAYLR